MRIAAALTVFATAALLSGCGSSDNNSSEIPKSSTAASTASTTSAPAKSSRGTDVKAIGQESGIGKAGAEPVLKWTVTGIKVDQPCTEELSLPAKNGHFVVVSIDAQTSSEFDQAKLGGAGWFHPGNHWQLVDSAGVTHPHADSDAVYRCTKADWPVDLAPGSKYSFKLTFDSNTPTGALLFMPPSWPGWEWAF